MRNVFWMATLLFFSSLGFGDKGPTYSKVYQHCMDKSGGITTKVTLCMADELRRQEKRLLENYGTLLHKVSKNRQAELDATQSLWKKFRDANCNFYDDPDGGTVATLASNECFLRSTAERADELKSLLDSN